MIGRPIPIRLFGDEVPRLLDFLLAPFRTRAELLAELRLMHQLVAHQRDEQLRLRREQSTLKADVEAMLDELEDALDGARLPKFRRRRIGAAIAGMRPKLLPSVLRGGQPPEGD